MEALCTYCKKPFLPKRTDSLYCSHSCRQLAYVLRKAKTNEIEVIQGLQITKVSENEKNDPSIQINTNEDTVDIYPSSESESKSYGENKPDKLTDNEDYLSNTQGKEADSSINQSRSQVELTDINNEGTGNKISVNKTEEKKSINTSAKIPSVTKPEIKPILENSEAEYKEYVSRYVNELDQLHVERDNWVKLDNFFESKDSAGLWMSERYRCLVECLLMFSEMKQIELDDLKEVCNAFTSVLQSDYFNYLHPSYPYINEVKELRERIKRVCLKSEDNIFIKYKLNKEQRQNLLLTRMELSQFVPKIKFNELNFIGK